MFLLWIAVIIAFVGLVQVLDRVRRLERTADDLRRTVERLTKRLEEGAAPIAARAPAPKPAARYDQPPAVTPRPPVEEHVDDEETVEEPVAVAREAAPIKPVVTAPPVTPPPPPVTPPPSRPRAAAPEPARPKRSFDLETLIGVKLFAI